MKKAILAIAATGMLFGLFGCNHSEVNTLKPTQAAELTPMQQSWRGVIPCADCEGIETSLFLEKDGTWVMNERYQGVSRDPSSFGSYGTWARTADKLVLTDSEGEITGNPERAGVYNLLSIYSACTNGSIEDSVAHFAGKGYGDLKTGVAEAIIETLKPIQTEYARLLADKAYLNEMMKLGAERAQATARKTVNKVYHKMGFDSFKA